MKVILVLMAMTLSAVAAPSDPGETAVRFLEKVRAKELNLEPGADTALSPHTSAAKRREIARRLDRMSQDLGNDPLEVGAVKQDGDLAAVLVRKIGGFDPNRMGVFPIALVKRGAKWAAAPVPASFENAGIGYAAALRQRLVALEDWMIRERVVDLEELRDQSANRMRRRIEESLPAATLRTLNSRQVVERFLVACESRKLPEIFGLLGGLDAESPGDWPLRVKAAERSVAAGPEITQPWRLLISSDVLRAIVLQEEDQRNALVSIACLDPSDSRPRVRLVHLDLSKSNDELWRINLPGEFLREDGQLDEDDDGLDSDLLDAFPSELAGLYPPSPKPTAAEARQAVLAALQEGGLENLIRQIRLDGDPAGAREACIRAARFWWTFRDPSSVCEAVPLSARDDERFAAASFQIFSARNPERLDFKVLYFRKSADGWYWVPCSDPELDVAFRNWTDLQAKSWRNTWKDALLADSPILTTPAADAPTEAESRRLVESWFRTLQAGDLTEALRLTARLNLPDSKAVLLRNLGYELISSRKNPGSPVIIGVQRGEGWTAVGTRLRVDHRTTFPLYPVIATSAGPRLLLEIDLSETGKRSRDFLNKTTLQRLETFSPVASARLKELFRRHQTAANAAESP